VGWFLSFPHFLFLCNNKNLSFHFSLSSKIQFNSFQFDSSAIFCSQSPSI
jgi:hypothetical protein